MASHMVTSRMAIPKGGDDSSEIGEPSSANRLGKVKQNERDTGNNEHDALLHRRIVGGDREEDERIWSNDPPCDESTRVSQDHGATDPENGHIDYVDPQESRRKRLLGNAAVGDGEQKLRMGVHSLCRRWLAAFGLSEISIEINRVALDETRKCGCDDNIGGQGTQVDCRFG